MRALRLSALLLFLPLVAVAQSAPSTSAKDVAPAVTAAGSASPNAVSATTNTNQIVIPSGTKVPLALKQGMSTKNAREGDPVYAETTFPIVVNDRIIIPAGTYVQGRIQHVQRAGHVKGRAEILMHFTTLIYPSGYTVVMPGSIDNMPGSDKTATKDAEGTVQENGQTGEKLGKAVDNASKMGGAGALVGLAAGGGARGAGYGGLTGVAVGTAIAMLGRGADVKLDPGTSIQMVIQRDVPLDPGRILMAGK